MSGNSFGQIFKITTFGESHGKSIGVVIDGCPSGVYFDEVFIQKALQKRAPGSSLFVSPRSEPDELVIHSGVFENYTTGAPIAMLITNKNFDSAPYDEIKNLYRPGHAQFTYLEKYKHYDHRGSGRASARETAARVAAGALAELILKDYGIELDIALTQIGSIKAKAWLDQESSIFCKDPDIEPLMMDYLKSLIYEGDSCGGIVTGKIKNVPVGLGEPVFDRFEARLAQSMLSIPATKGFEIGEGFESVNFKGSEYNDLFIKTCDIGFSSNHSGGTLGGITSGQDVEFRVVFKPASSIKKEQKTLDFYGNETTIKLNPNSKHDPCVAIRGCAVVKAMAALVTLDFLLLNKLTKHSLQCSLP